MTETSNIKVNLEDIPNHPQSTDCYQAVHFFTDEETNKKNWLCSPQEFESLQKCREWISNHKCVLGYGEVDWEIMMIGRSIID